MEHIVDKAQDRIIGRVSIRRADLGLLERLSLAETPATPEQLRFNPPGGFGAFGTALRAYRPVSGSRFQSAGRIWGFWNEAQHRLEAMIARVSIRRADLGLLELMELAQRIAQARKFQSAGRIWGFWNPAYSFFTKLHRRCFNPPGGFGAFGTCLHRMSRRMLPCFNPPGGFGAFGTTQRPILTTVTRKPVSIRRADLGLLERTYWRYSNGMLPRFNPPGGFGAFGTRPMIFVRMAVRRSFNPPGGFGAFGTVGAILWPLGAK